MPSNLGFKQIVNTAITYEFPLNERIRMFIRIEQLFIQLQHFLAGASVIDKRAAIKALQDILLILSRNDLKSEILKEIDRHAKTFNQMITQDADSAHNLQKTVADLQEIGKKLYATNGKIGMNVMGNDLFQSIAQRSSIPGGTCSFDLPAFHYWLEQDSAVQALDLKHWTEPFNDIRCAIDLLLMFVRKSGKTTQEVAKEGFFQLGLDSTLPYQLLRISVDQKQRFFAETSGGKHRFTIRLMQPSTDSNRPTQTKENVPFALTICVF